jgi:hypothetical protein
MKFTLILMKQIIISSQTGLAPSNIKRFLPMPKDRSEAQEKRLNNQAIKDAKRILSYVFENFGDYVREVGNPHHNSGAYIID